MNAGDDQGSSQQNHSAPDRASTTSRKRSEAVGYVVGTLIQAYAALPPQTREGLNKHGRRLAEGLRSKSHWRTDKKRERLREEWDRLREEAIRPEVTFRVARTLLKEVAEHGPMDLPSLAARMGVSPEDRIFRDALKIALKEERIVESTSGLQTRNEAYLLEQNPILRDSGAIDAKAEAIIKQLEANGLMTLGDLRSSIQPRARRRSIAEEAAFSAALERELYRGHIEWLAPRTFGVPVDRLIDYEATGKRE